MTSSQPDSDNSAQDAQDTNSFEQLQDSAPPGFIAEFWQFLRYNKKWWFTPILLTLAALGLLVALTATGAAPFIYPF